MELSRSTHTGVHDLFGSELAMADATTRVVYRTLLRLIQRSDHFCDAHRLVVYKICQEEFRCSKMASESTLDDAFDILRLLARHPVRETAECPR